MEIFKDKSNKAVTFAELLMSLVVLSILTMLALPMHENDVKREKEKQLRHSLFKIRNAIDKYWEEENRKNPKNKYNSKYPKSLQELVDKNYLRKIPIDPFTGKADWVTKSSTDSPDSIMSDKSNVFDIKSNSSENGMNGVKYKEW